MKGLFQRALKKVSYYWGDAATRSYIKHNLKHFPQQSHARKSGAPEVIFEFNWLHSSHIASSYFANVLANKYRASIIAYSPMRSPSFLKWIEWEVLKFFSLGDFAVYRSFGTTGFFRPQISPQQSAKAKELSDDILGRVKEKAEVERISLDGILLGDLIYDSYLRTYNEPTIEISSEKFKQFLLRSIELYVFWRDYFRDHDVRAVNASHSVYTLAIPLRIAISKDIPAYVVGAIHAYRVTKENMIDSCDFLEYREVFQNLPPETQVAGLAMAKERIALRFSGQVGVDMHYGIVSAYGAHKRERLLKESGRIKVLIATHCFFDSPHSYGYNLFPDFYEWLDFLGKMTKETDYDWYIKTHPDYTLGTMEIIEQFIQKYPRLCLLPADSSHHQIVEEGINVALTCYGTIGFEYAALGIPVVNASVNNPHVAYNFNLHPASVEEYRSILENLASINLTIDKSEVYEYYFMRHIFDTKNWLFNQYDKMLEEVGGYYKQFSSQVYGVWMRECSEKKHAEMMEKTKKFIESGSTCM